MVTLLRSWLTALHDAFQTTSNAIECKASIERSNQALLREFSALGIGSARSHGPIISKEYSVEAQLTVLCLDTTTIQEPVLDIGCGREASLVKWLRNRQINAIGMDTCTSEVPGCIVADWFQFPWQQAKFGTVIAHLSFSLQFLHQHLRPDGEAEKYARHYVKILHSLSHGGRFVYAPGLPFIERHLSSDQYIVKRYAIERLPNDERAANVFSQGLGESPIYTCHVKRI